MLLAINSFHINAQNVLIGVGQQQTSMACPDALFMSAIDQHSTMEYLIPKSILQTILQFDSGAVINSLAVLMGAFAEAGYLDPQGTFTISMQNVN